MQFNGQEIVRAILENIPVTIDAAGELEVDKRLPVVTGGTTQPAKR